jgi:hypothetical protein
MTPKNLSLIGLFALVAGIYIYNFTDWMRPAVIQISAQIRPIPGSAPPGGVYPVTFTLNSDQRITAVKVVCASAVATNSHATPLWQLCAASNSTPLRGFAYGESIAGMKPAGTNAGVEPLKPNETYRLYVEAGRYKGQVDFQAREAE